MASIAAVLCFSGAIHAEHSADAVLTEMGLSASEKQRILKGEFVTAEVGAVSERDLSFAVAFLVKTSPDALSKRAVDGVLLLDDPQVKAYGKLTTPGSLADFSGLQITDDEARALVSAAPGDAMNASSAELTSLRGLRGAPTKDVQDQLHRILLARYQSYRASGLGGIAAYDRGGGGFGDVAADLKKASESATGVKKQMPALYALLSDYPKATLPGFKENFVWVKSVIRDKPTYVLAHIFSAGDGDARAIVRREFYVSTGYNAEQSVAGFLPVAGGTLVLSLSHAFTDQVAGKGSSMKRNIGSKVMAGQMKQIFERGRKRVER
jgi:hypothetical protein